ncbi:MAG: class I SAM-dependent methyltransferase [bacterium]|nr:class I SAM-dependent methyltransferase [bacterium]
MKKYSLGEKSKSYYEEAGIYRLFSAREDAPGKIFETLLSEMKGKTLLDLGCGSGKYTKLFAPYAPKIVALDASKDQLSLAEKDTDGYDNIDFVHTQAEDMKLPSKSIDVALASWVLGTVEDEKRRKDILCNIERTLKPRGKIFLVENDTGGEFEQIRGRTNDPLERTKKYNEWLVKNGFREYSHFTTFFEFKDLDEARKVIGFIWGKEAKHRVQGSKIEHKVAIYCK